jgi:hypothetical protein
MPVNKYDRPQAYRYQPMNYAMAEKAMAMQRAGFDLAKKQANEMAFNINAITPDYADRDALIEEYEGKVDDIVSQLTKDGDYRGATDQLAKLNKVWQKDKSRKTMESTYADLEEKDKLMKEAYLTTDPDKYYRWKAYELENYRKSGMVADPNDPDKLTYAGAHAHQFGTLYGDPREKIREISKEVAKLADKPDAMKTVSMTTVDAFLRGEGQYDPNETESERRNRAIKITQESEGIDEDRLFSAIMGATTNNPEFQRALSQELLYTQQFEPGSFNTGMISSATDKLNLYNTQKDALEKKKNSKEGLTEKEEKLLEKVKENIKSLESGLNAMTTGQFTEEGLKNAAMIQEDYVSNYGNIEIGKIAQAYSKAKSYHQMASDFDVVKIGDANAQGSGSDGIDLLKDYQTLSVPPLVHTGQTVTGDFQEYMAGEGKQYGERLGAGKYLAKNIQEKATAISQIDNEVKDKKYINEDGSLTEGADKSPGYNLLQLEKEKLNHDLQVMLSPNIVDEIISAYTISSSPQHGSSKTESKHFKVMQEIFENDLGAGEAESKEHIRNYLIAAIKGEDYTAINADGQTVTFDSSNNQDAALAVLANFSNIGSEYFDNLNVSENIDKIDFSNDFKESNTGELLNAFRANPGDFQIERYNYKKEKWETVPSDERLFTTLAEDRTEFTDYELRKTTGDAYINATYTVNHTDRVAYEDANDDKYYKTIQTGTDVGEFRFKMNETFDRRLQEYYTVKADEQRAFAAALKKEGHENTARQALTRAMEYEQHVSKLGDRDFIANIQQNLPLDSPETFPETMEALSIAEAKPLTEDGNYSYRLAREPMDTKTSAASVRVQIVDKNNQPIKVPVIEKDENGEEIWTVDAKGNSVPKLVMNGSEIALEELANEGIFAWNVGEYLLEIKRAIEALESQ